MIKPSEKRSVGSARLVVLGLIALAATAAIVIGYAFLTRGQAPTPGRPLPLPQDAAERPKTRPSTTLRPSSAVAITSPKPATQTVVATPAAFKDALFYDDFVVKTLFPSAKWVATRDGDFKEAVADIVDGRLRTRVGTIGTRDDTVKHLGLRTAEPVVDLSRPLEVAAEIDWNNQANGCYLQASLFLCPTATDATAAAEKDWLKLEYVGVPPGKNARAWLARRQGGNLKPLYTEGWPQADPKERTGRPVGKQKVVLRLDSENIEIIENGKPLFGPQPHGCSFLRAYLYLEVCSHSNYPPREIFFDNVVLRPAPARGL